MCSLCRHHPILNSNALLPTPLPFILTKPARNLALGMKLYGTSRIHNSVEIDVFLSQILIRKKNVFRTNSVDWS